MARRPLGTGGIWLSSEGWWVASVSLKSGRQVRRKRRTREDAEAALDTLIAEHEGDLGYFYSYPRQFRFGTVDRPIRKTLSPRLRFDVLRRDGFRCRYCGSGPDASRLSVDHILAVADGGTDDAANLVTACQPCNAGKADLSLDGAERTAIGVA